MARRDVGANIGAKTGVTMMVSPLNGARTPTGRHAANSGGKPGRSGRKPDEFKRRLETVRDEKALPVLEEILGGTISYPLNGTCEHCGKVSRGPTQFGELLKLVPSVDARLRGVDLSMRYTAGLERVIRLEGGIDGTRQAFDAVKQTIRRVLAPDEADDLIAAIHADLKRL